MSRIPPAVIAEVNERAAEHCEICGWPALRVQYHHRQARGMGGTGDEQLRAERVDVAVNLLRCHPRCHAWAHAHGEQARKHGWIVPRGADPADVPVVPLPRLARC